MNIFSLLKNRTQTLPRLFPHCTNQAIQLLKFKFFGLVTPKKFVRGLRISVPLLLATGALISCEGQTSSKDKQKNIDYSPLFSPAPSPEELKTSSSGSVEINTSESGNDEGNETCRKLYENLAGGLDSSSSGIRSSATNAALVSSENPEIVKSRNQQLVNEINNFRSHGLNPEEVARLGSIVQLKQDQELQKAAEIHLSDLSARRYFSHKSPEGCSLSQRVLLGTNFGAGRVGENLARGQADAAEARRDWQDSPGHRINMLGPHYARIGVASGLSGDGEIIWVAVFGAKASDFAAPPSPNLGTSASSGSSSVSEGEASRPSPRPQPMPTSPPRDSNNTVVQDFRTVTCVQPFETVWTGVAANRFAYCKKGDQASGPVTKEMRKLCIEWGGGTTACASNVWHENMYLSARGALYCPRGSQLEPTSKKCLE